MKTFLFSLACIILPFAIYFAILLMIGGKKVIEMDEQEKSLNER